MYFPKKCYCKCLPYKIYLHNPCLEVCDFFKYLIVGDDNNNNNNNDNYNENHIVPLQEIVIHKPPKFTKDSYSQTDETCNTDDVADISLEQWEPIIAD